ncbi:MW1434 family type I TA system toxin [Limibacter armeniacum]|uniref:Thoeris anti-defense Tad2 family protein n=1 Tax=Limibacter armeniacum TaxID=466084 RepID=UPI002FE5A1BE
MNINQVIEALKEGKMLRRPLWEKDFFIFRQVPSEIPQEIVPKMTSLPQPVKDEFVRRFNDLDNHQINSISYNDQIAHVGFSNLITGYNFSVEDTFAEDWTTYQP